MNEFAIPVLPKRSGSIVPATMLDASMLVDDNCVQLAASLADVLTVLITSTIFLRS